MIKIVFVAAVLVFAQVNCASLKDGPNQGIAFYLLNKTKIAAGEKSSEFDGKITGWLQESVDGQEVYAAKMTIILDEIVAATSEKIKEFEDEAIDKGQAGTQCLAIAFKTLASNRSDAESYRGCMTNIDAAVSRTLGAVQQQISWIVNEIKDWDAKCVACNGNDTCYGELIPELETALVDIPQRINDKILWTNDYVLDASTDRLKNCDTSARLTEGAATILTDLRTCIDNA